MPYTKDCWSRTCFSSICGGEFPGFLLVSHLFCFCFYFCKETCLLDVLHPWKTQRVRVGWAFESSLAAGATSPPLLWRHNSVAHSTWFPQWDWSPIAHSWAKHLWFFSASLSHHLSRLSHLHLVTPSFSPIICMHPTICPRFWWTSSSSLSPCPCRVRQHDHNHLCYYDHLVFISMFPH